jgi:amino acid adenylation domain-containing protein
VANVPQWDSASPAAATVQGEVTLASLSFAQERIWFLEQLYPDSPTYNMPVALRFQTQLNRQALQGAFDEIIDRHEVLRTVFVAVDGVPQQMIFARQPISVGYTDLRKLPKVARHARLAHLASENTRLPFKLSQGPLLRASVVQTASHDCTLLICLHHLIADGWSIDLLIAEIWEGYWARMSGRRALLPNLAIQYADFAQWQRGLLQDPSWQEGLSFWIRALASLPPVLNLPTDRPRPTAQTLRGAVTAFCVEPESLERCKRFARETDTTLFMLLLAVFQVLLYRYSGQPEFAIGTPVANRTRKEVEHLIGLFINTIALPCRIEGNVSFLELLREVRKQFLEALAYQHVPFEKVVETLLPCRNLGATPIFQTLFVLQTTGKPGEKSVVEPDGATVDSPLGNGTAKYDLTLTVVEANRKLFCTLEYSTDLFDTATVGGMAQHYAKLLDSALAHPECPVEHMAMLSPEERQKIVHEWNSTESPLAEEVCLHRLIERQSATAPDRIAVRHDGASVTYRQLEENANRIAARLRRAAVQPGDRVALCMKRTPQLIAALWAILKCGAAYVPLDASYPLERNRFILSDSRSVVVATQPSLQALLPHDLPRIDCESYLPEAHPISAERTGDSEAYVIYTSGSTGVPKGVRISHASASSFAAWVRHAFSDRELEGVLASTSICFDLSVFEIFGTLCAGGTVVLVEDALNIESAGAPVMLINTVPSAMKELLQLNLVPATVLTVNLAGEPLPHSLAQAIYSQTSAERVLNLYGPTEDTTYSTMATITRECDQIVVGRPIANRRAYILDSAAQPVPTGVVGEIYLGGAGVALGYNDRPELNAEKFLADPFVPASRAFRTGDLGRFRSDGQIELLGRADGQIKLRGFRIEVDEIKSILNAQPGVADCVVRLWHDKLGPGLIAYVISKPNTEVDLPLLQAELGRRLPAFMVPAYWRILDRLPRTPNGKVDTRALPPPETATPTIQAVPSTDTEKAIADIWREVLGRAEVPLDESFFALGGHSLLVTQVAVRVQEKLGLALSLREYFENPTISSFSARAETLSRAQAAPPGRIPKTSRLQPLPLSFAQQRLWFFDQLAGGNALYTIPWSYSVSGPFDIHAFDRAVGTLVDRHETLRTRFISENGQPAQIIANQGVLDIDYYDLELATVAQRKAAITDLARENLAKPFQLDECPLLRVTVVRESAIRHVIFLAMHHIISDAWSMTILHRDISELYRAIASGRTPELPELRIQYADFAVWQKAAFEQGQMEGQLAYWRERLSGAPRVVTIPSDRPRPRYQTFNGTTERFTIDPPLQSKIDWLARDQSATPFVVTLTAFQILLGNYSGQADVVSGTLVSGRHFMDVHDLVGFFVNTLPIRTHLNPDDSFLSVLANVKAAVLEAFDHQDAPFERVVTELKPQRHLDYSPVFQVLFAFQDVLWPAVGGESAAGPNANSDLSDEAALVRVTTSKFDMSLGLSDGNGGLFGVVEYNTDLYEPATIQRFIADYVSILECMVDSPEQQLREFLSFPAVAEPAHLGDLQASASDTLIERAPPRDDVEKLLHETWKEVLHVEDVGIHENFFNIGGDSLLAIQVVVHLKSQGIEISLREIFEWPTISTLAELIGNRKIETPDPIPVQDGEKEFVPEFDELSDAEVDDLLRELLRKDVGV